MYGTGKVHTAIQEAGEVQLQLLVKFFMISVKRGYRIAHNDDDVDYDHY